jgi:hypothetical protein
MVFVAERAAPVDRTGAAHGFAGYGLDPAACPAP